MFIWAKREMRNIKLTLEYDGSDFHGWQIQNEVRTVQGTIEDGIERVFAARPTVYASGRTDAGVHALGQVANFKFESRLSLSEIKCALNANLPEDVRIVSALETDDDFHARYSARQRVYRYVISKRKRAIARRYAWFCRYALDLQEIRKASRYLLGDNRYRGFSREVAGEEHYRSIVYSLDWQENGEEIVMRICAKRFLHNMVRIIVGTMVDVGRGKIPADFVLEILKSGRREMAGVTIPPHGLYLTEVIY